MLTGGIDGYPNAVIVAEDVTMTPAGGDTGQAILAGVPRLYDSAGGNFLLRLPFYQTAVALDDDGAAIIEEAMRAWVAFRHMERT